MPSKADKQKASAMKPIFRNNLLSGKTLIGTVVTLPCAQTSEILAYTGFDWLWIDGEHSPLEMGEIQGILQATQGRCAGVVRIPSNDEVYVKKALDIGAAGLIAPHVDTLEIAQRLVQSAKYPPLGQRSIAAARAHGYGLYFADYLKHANEQIALIVQIEHVNGARNIESILEVDGVDAVMIGPYDLSGSLGKPGEIDDPEVQDLIKRVQQACLKRKKPIGIFADSVDAGRRFLDQGFSLIAVGVDIMMLGKAAQQVLSGMRSKK